jgi:TRAP-type C4-dicarboxylate transport system permease small subunit
VNPVKWVALPLAKAMFWVAAVALTSIMVLTVSDVFLRIFKHPILGTYEIVGFLAAWAIGFAIPQTSVDRGHVLMDFLTGRLPPWANRILVPVTRLLGIGLFLIVGYNLYVVGNDMRAAGEVTPLRHLPLFPLAYGVGVACLVECLVLAGGLFDYSGAES